MNDALLNNYNRAPITIVKGDGCELIDDRGVRYLDFIAGIGVCALGHAHPAIAEAIAAQGYTLVHTSNLFYHEPAGELARQLVQRSGLGRVFFCNSGSEANEAAIKLARKLAYRRGDTHRTTILACEGSFHGRTMGALAATSNRSYKEGFRPLPEGFAFTPFNDVDALEANITDEVAAFIVEPVQGENGVRPADAAFLAAARRLCDERGVLLIFDEIQCGMGRLGPLFAFQYYGVVPDVVTMAKALANGLPIGAMLVVASAAEGLRPGDHGSTFGGSPVPAAAALAHLRVRDAMDLGAQVNEQSAYFFEQLRSIAETYAGVIDTPRGAGLLVGVPVREPYQASDIVPAMRERGVLAGTAGGNMVRFAPPLIVSSEQIDRAVAAFAEALETVRETVTPHQPSMTQRHAAVELRTSASTRR